MEKDISAMGKVCSNYRGDFLQIFATMENIIDIIIIRYFSKNKSVGEEMKLLWLDSEGLNFNAKSSAVFFIIKSHYQNYEHIIEEIDKLKTIRNKLAHRTLRTTPEEIENFDGHTITLVGFKTQKNKRKIDNLMLNKDIFEGYIKAIETIKESLRDLNREIAMKK